MKKITEKTATDRVSQFWEEMKGIVKISNEINRENPIYEYTSPLITHYFLWRILFELKLANKQTANIGVERGPTDTE